MADRALEEDTRIPSGEAPPPYDPAWLENGQVVVSDSLPLTSSPIGSPGVEEPQQVLGECSSLPDYDSVAVHSPPPVPADVSQTENDSASGSSRALSSPVFQGPPTYSEVTQCGNGVVSPTISREIRHQADSPIHVRVTSEGTALLGFPDPVTEFMVDGVRVVLKDPRTHRGDLLLEGGREQLQQMTAMLHRGAGTRYFSLPFFGFPVVMVHVTFVICVVMLATQLSEDSAYVSSSNNMWSLTFMLSGVGIIVSYMAILVEGYYSHAGKMLRCLVSRTELRHLVDTWRKRVPVVTWHVTCYHYVGRMQVIEGPPVWREAHITPYDEQERIISHSESHKFVFDECQDLSGGIERFANDYMVWVRFMKVVGFTDVMSKTMYENARDLFFQRSRDRDQNMETSTKFVIEGLVEKPVMVYMGSDEGAVRRQWKCYMVATALLLTIPYRILLFCLTRPTVFAFVKLIGVRPRARLI